ncbi:MAG: hypothetical protein QM758_04705 [Armatimonas sp.]
MKSFWLTVILLPLCLPVAHARQSPALTARLKPLNSAPLQAQTLRSRLSLQQTKSLRGKIAGFARKQARFRKQTGKALSDTEIKTFLIGLAAQVIESGGAKTDSGKPTGPLSQEMQDAARNRALTPELRALAQRAGGSGTNTATMHASKAKDKAADAASKAVDTAASVTKDAARSAAETTSEAVDYAADVAKAVVGWLME